MLYSRRKTMESSDVCIIGGFGHVGLPLGISLADAGLSVCLYDLNTALRPTIEKGTMPFIEYGAEEILPRVIGKTLHCSGDIADIARAKTVIITIGTPVDEYLSPKTRVLFELADTLIPHLSAGQCLLLRSTVCPGATRAFAEYLHAHGAKVHVGNCPERIAQGYAIREIRELPQIISGCSTEAVAAARSIFGALNVDVIEVDVEEAELCKLFLNAWRYIQFAAGNQFYMIAKERGLDYDMMYHAMTHRYPRASTLPKPGFAAGPCLLKDTMQLAASRQNQFPLGHAAMMINEGLPSFLVEALLREGVTLRGARIGILGMTFKADIDDTRDSLSYKLRKILQFHGAEVLCSDEYVRDPSFVKKEELLKRCDILFVGVPHGAYRNLRIPASLRVVDLWGVLTPKAS